MLVFIFTRFHLSVDTEVESSFNSTVRRLLNTVINSQKLMHE